MRVEIYTTPTCGYCHQAKQYLADRGVDFMEHDVSRDRTAGEEMVRLTGQMGVPVIVVNSESIIGFNRARLDQLLAQSENRQRISLGLKVADASRYSIEKGAYVGVVAPASPAERAGIMPRDIIVGINNMIIKSAADLERATATLQRGRSISIAFIREGRTLQAETIL